MKSFLSMLLVGVLCGGAWADTPAPLTWQDCIRLAARSNPDLISAIRAMESSRAQYYESYNGILPKVTLTNSYSDSKTFRLDESKTWQAGLNASLDLVDFAQYATIQAASASLKQSQATLEVAGTTTLLNLYKAFAALLYAQEEVTVNTNIRNTWKMNAQMIDLRYKSGSESKGNNMNTQAQLLQAEVGLNQSGRDTQVAQQQLSQVLGYDEFKALVATGTWDAPPVPTPHPDFMTMLVRLPQIRAQEAVVEQAEAGVKLAHSTLWPALSLNYLKGTQGTSEFPQDPSWAFIGTVSLPIFANGLTSTYYASQAAQRALEKAREDLRSLRNQQLTNLENAWSSFAQAEDQIRVQRAFLEADRQRKAEYDVLYQSGLMSFQEWILVVEEYVNFQTSFLRAEQNLILAEAQWRFATGDTLGE